MNYKETKGLEGSYSSKNLLNLEQKKQVFLGRKKLKELISACKNRQEREVVVGKFSEILKKKVAPIVASAILAVSPLLLAGCDEDTTNKENQTGVNNASIVTEVETDENGEVIGYTNVWAENESWELPSEFDVSEMDVPFRYFEMEKVLDGSYAGLIPELKEQFNAELEEWGEYPPENKIAKSTAYDLISELIQPQTTYALDLYVYRDTSGNQYKFYKEGTDTAVVIITTPSGERFYNGYVDNVPYTDWQDKLPPQIGFVLTSEKASLISQSGTSSPADMWYQAIMGYMLTPRHFTGVLNPILNCKAGYSYIEMCQPILAHKEAVTVPIAGEFEEIAPPQDYWAGSSLSLQIQFNYDRSTKVAKLNNININTIRIGEHDSSENPQRLVLLGMTPSSTENIVLPQQAQEQAE